MTALAAGPAVGTVSVVIVSYRTGAALWNCLDRVLAEPAVGQVVLVDNGNDDATLAILRARAAGGPKLHIVTGHGNVGFAAGCNLGARAATRPYLLLLNPDCLIAPGSVAALLAAVGDPPRPWIATVRLLDETGAEQPGSRRNLATPLNCLAEMLRLGRLNLDRDPVPAAMVAVPAISGAFMVMPRATWDALGGMDEGYFLHVEDLDFCLRHHRAGGVAYFAPTLTATHVKGTSAAAALFVERHKARGFRRYFRRHFAADRRPLVALVGLVLSAGLLLRGWLRDRSG